MNVGKKPREVAVICLAFMAALLFTACSSDPPVRRGSLSDAMDKSRDDYRGSREVPSVPAYGTPPGDESGAYRGSIIVISPGGSEAPGVVLPAGAELEPPFFGARGGRSPIMSGGFISLADGDIVLLAEASDTVEGVLYAGFLAPGLRVGSDLASSLDDSPLFLRAGIELRWTPFPDWQVLSPYLAGQMGGFALLWEYKNPLNADGYTITHDSLGGLHVSCGAGIYILNLESVKLGVSVNPEAYLFGDLTSQGFDNDYFYPVGGIRASAELLIRL